MAKRRRKLSFLKARDRPLPSDFSRDYVIALKALSRKHKSDPETVKAVKLLKRMSLEASLAGRGEVWIPHPGSTTGHYPVIENLPFSKIRTAVRKNTLKRKRAWAGVAASTRPFFPQHGAVGQLEKSLLPAMIVSLPFKKGRSPALLGKRVPGELQMAKSGSSIIPIRSISPDEWTQQGFQPLTFAGPFRPVLRRFLRKHPKLRGAKKGLRGLMEAGLETQGVKEQMLLGRKGKLSERRTKELVRKIAGEKQMVSVRKGSGSAYFPGKRGRGRIITRPNAAVASHEASHAVQHRKLGRAFKPLLVGLPAAAGPVSFLTAHRSASKDKKKSWRKGVGAGMAAWTPRIVLEAAASRRGLKLPGGIRTMAAGTGSYIAGAAAKSVMPAAMGKWIGRMKPPKTGTAIKHALDPVEVLIYEKGYQYGLRAFVRRHNVVGKLKRGALPAALSGLVLEGLRRAHTEFGIPPTTVDLTPVQRTTIRGEFSPYTNLQLGSFRNALLAKLSTADAVTASEIQKRIGKIEVEIIGRRAV